MYCKLSLKLSIVFLILLIIISPINAVQYDPPWAHDYTTVSETLNGTPQVINASNIQETIGYNATYYINRGADDAYNRICDDAIFFVDTHGVARNPNYTDGYSIVAFYDAETDNFSYLIGNYYSYEWEYPSYFLSNLTTELEDVLLAVYLSCWSGRDDPYTIKNLPYVSYLKGIDNSIGFQKSILKNHSAYWSDRFWARCYNGTNGQPQRIKDANEGAKLDVWMYYGSALDIWYQKLYYRTSYSDYITPARYGVV